MQKAELSGIEPRALGRRLQEARASKGHDPAGCRRHPGPSPDHGNRSGKGRTTGAAGRDHTDGGMFGRSVSELVGDREPIPDFAVQFRTAVSGAGSPKEQEEMSQAVQDFQRLCEDYLYIERLNGTSIQQNYMPQYSMRGSSPEDAAEDIASAERNRLGLGDGPLLNLREVLEDDVAIRVFSTNLPSRVAGLFAYTEELGGCIAVNARHPQERRRWSMAHEYGHFLTSRFHSEISMLVRVPARSGGGEVRRWLCPVFSHARDRPQKKVQ